MKRILIADDHDTVRRGVRSLINGRRDWIVCGESADGVDAIEKAKALQPDLVILDLAMGKLNGADAAEEIRAICPTAIVLVTSLHDPKPLLARLQDIGVRGFISKDHLTTDLLPAMDAALKGQTWFHLVRAR